MIQDRSSHFFEESNSIHTIFSSLDVNLENGTATINTNFPETFFQPSRCLFAIVNRSSLICEDEEEQDTTPSMFGYLNTFSLSPIFWLILIISIISIL